MLHLLMHCGPWLLTLTWFLWQTMFGLHCLLDRLHEWCRAQVMAISIGGDALL